MAFRGYLALNGTELTNTSRLLAHLGRDTPTSDIGVIIGVPSGPLLIESPPGSGLYLPNNDTPTVGDKLYSPGPLDPLGDHLYSVVPGGADQCALVESVDHPGLFEMPDTAAQVRPGLWSPPDGSRRWGPSMFLVGDMCWQEAGQCRECDSHLVYDDSWPELGDFLGDMVYRTELAPWHSTRQPESTEFLGILLTKIEGLGPVKVSRPVEEMVGSGGVAGPHRDVSQKLTFTASLFACTNAGLEFGLHWLACRLRETNDNSDSVLRFFHGHPSHTAAVPASLIREVHGAVLTQSPTVVEGFVSKRKPNQQATIYQITWQMGATSPYMYRPPQEVSVDWSTIESAAINWVHGPDCSTPDTCEDMPVLFSATCVPEEIEVVVTPPPVCGGCMPVGGVEVYTWVAPFVDYIQGCRETAINLTFTNLSSRDITLQAYWRICGTDIRCEDSRWPLQINGLPEGAKLVIDSVNRRFWAELAGRRRRPKGIVGTPNGAPWKPVVLDRTTCWEFVVMAPSYADFDVKMQLVDREP